MSGHNVFINANFNGNGDHSMCEFTLQIKFFTKWLLHIIYGSPDWRGSIDSQDDQHSGVQKMRQRARTNEDNTR